MKIFIICSKNFYDKVKDVKDALESQGHEITLPNSYNDPFAEDSARKLSGVEYQLWKAKMLEESMKKIEKIDAVLVLNFEKNGIKNYIGGATFLEMYDAYKSGKKIFMYNDVPEGILKDEIFGFNPLIIKADLALVK